jgi:outer membrane lipoprotein-sorting protein
MKKLFRLWIAILFLLSTQHSMLSTALSSTGSNYPTTLDSWVDKGAGDSLTVADVNQFRSAIEKLESGPIRPNKGTAAAPAYSFQGDSDTGFDSSGANILDWSIGGTFQWRMDGTAYFPVADNSEDIGKSANRIKDLYMAGVFRAGLDATLGTITTNDPILNATATWNAAGVTFEGIKINVTNTASAAASSLLDLQVGGTSLFKIGKGGNVASDFLVKPPNERRWAYFAPTGTALTTVADSETTTAGTPTNVGGVPPSRQYATAATNGADAGMAGNSSWARANNPRMQFRGLLSSTASIRAWIGLADEALTTVTGTDTIARDFAAFRYSTVAGDANWKGCTGTGGTMTCTDTGVAAGTSDVEFEIILNDSVPNAVFKINGATVATNTTNLPASAQDMTALTGIETQAAAAKNIKMQWMYLDADK